jgi:uncharacterized protein YkwD
MWRFMLGLCMRRGLGWVVAAALALAQPLWAGDVEQQVLAAVNKARAKAGCPALAVDTKLTAAAYGHAKAMAEKNFFGHNSKNGAHFTSRIKAQGYAYADAAENIGMGYSSAQQIIDSWMSSSGHRKNILDCGLTETGIAMYYQADDKPLPGKNFTARYYWVEVFARPK